MNSSLLLIVLSAILWGTAGVSGKYLINSYSMPSLAIGALRLMIASPILLAISKVQIKEKVIISKKRHILLLFLQGIAAASYQILYFAAVDRIMVSIATLIALCTGPIFVTILSRIFIKEKICVKVFVSLVISIIGTALIIGINGSESLSGLHNSGYIFALGAGLSYAVYTMCGKILVSYYPPVKITSISFIIGSLVILPFARIPGSLPWVAWGILFYLGIVPTALAYIIFSVGLKKSSATMASIASLFEPLTSTTLALLLVGEKFSRLQTIGSILLIAALLLIVFKDCIPLRMRSTNIRTDKDIRRIGIK